MLDFSSVFEFSRTHCVAICAFLVPANLIATLRTIILVGLRRPQSQIWQATAIAIIPAVVMVLHVLTWLVVGVIMAPTYILLWLGATCLLINLWAIVHTTSLSSLVRRLRFEGFSWLRQIASRVVVALR